MRWRSWHGVLCDAEGKPKVYEPGKVPPDEAAIWPDDLDNDDVIHEWWVGLIETQITERLGTVPCTGDHGIDPSRPCPECGAAR